MKKSIFVIKKTKKRLKNKKITYKKKKIIKRKRTINKQKKYRKTKNKKNNLKYISKGGVMSNKKKSREGTYTYSPIIINQHFYTLLKESVVTVSKDNFIKFSPNINVIFRKEVKIQDFQKKNNKMIGGNPETNHYVPPHKRNDFNQSNYSKLLRDEFVIVVNKPVYTPNPKEKEIREIFREQFITSYNTNLLDLTNNSFKLSKSVKISDLNDNIYIKKLNEEVRQYLRYKKGKPQCNLYYENKVIISELNIGSEDIVIIGYPDPGKMGSSLEIDYNIDERIIEQKINNLDLLFNFVKYLKGIDNIGETLYTGQLDDEYESISKIIDQVKKPGVDINKEIFKGQILEVLSKEVENIFKRPNITINYIFHIYRKIQNQDGSNNIEQLFLNFREISDSYLPVFEKIRKIISIEIPKLFNLLLEGETQYDNFMSTLDISKAAPVIIECEYIHPCSKTTKNFYNFDSMITLEEIIFNLSQNKNYFQNAIFRYPVRKINVENESYKLPEQYKINNKIIEPIHSQELLVEDNYIRDPDFFKKLKIIICNYTYNDEYEIYGQYEMKYYYIIIKPNIRDKIEDYVDISDNSKLYYGQRENNKCEKIMYLDTINLDLYKVIEFIEITEEKKTDFYKKLYAKWSFPILKTSYKNKLNDIINKFQIDVGDNNLKNYYPDIPFKILRNGIYKYKNLNDNKLLLYDTTEQSQIFKTDYLEKSKLFLVYKSIDNKYVIWIYRLPEDFNINDELTRERIEHLQFTNSLRTLYDLKSKEELESIIGAIKKSKKSDVNILNPKINSLYCNKIITYEMSVFHIQILPYNFRNNPLYSNNINVINSFRLVSVYKILNNFEIDDNYYKKLKNNESNQLFNCGFMINTNIF